MAEKLFQMSPGVMREKPEKGFLFPNDSGIMRLGITHQAVKINPSTGKV